MEYQLKSDCKRVILHVLAGADVSLIGIKIGKASVISMKKEDFLEIVLKLWGPAEVNRVIWTLSEYSISVYDDDSPLIVLEILQNDSSDYFWAEGFCRMLKLYKSEDVFPCYYVCYHMEEEQMKIPGLTLYTHYRHAIGYTPIRYKLTEDERVAFPNWYETYFPKVYSECKNPVLKSMLEGYDQSYLIGIKELEFIMLFSILEMAFVKGKKRISLQISCGPANFLENQEENAKKLKKKIDKLYDERCGYVHSGKKINQASLFELREIVRRVIVKLIDLDYYMEDKSFKKFRNQLQKREKKHA